MRFWERKKCVKCIWKSIKLVLVVMCLKINCSFSTASLAICTVATGIIFYSHTLLMQDRLKGLLLGLRYLLTRQRSATSACRVATKDEGTTWPKRSLQEGSARTCTLKVSGCRSVAFLGFFLIKISRWKRTLSTRKKNLLFYFYC